MQLGELLGLQWSDIDFVNRTISISRQLNRLKDFDPKATAKTKLGIQDDVKTVMSYRVISIAPTIITLLQSYKARQDIESKKWGKAHKKLQMVFAREDGYYIDPSTFRQQYKLVLKKAGLKNCTVHALRHTFATRALEAGVPIKVVSNILGHAGLQITMDTYSHVLPQLQDDAMLRIAEYISS
jgi:integrase